MTLIVGIKCADGVVVGADGGVSIPGGILEPARKLRVLHDELIMGVAGHNGLGQLFRDRVARFWKSTDKPASDETTTEYVRRIRNAILEDAVTVAAQANAFKPHHGGISEHVNFESLIALPINGQSELIRIAPGGSLAVENNGPPYFAIGSGAAQATPFLAFLRRIFFRDRLLGFDEGVLFAAWAIQNAIELGVPNVSLPLQIISLSCAESNETNGVSVREFDEAEIGITLELVSNFEDFISSMYGAAYLGH